MLLYLAIVLASASWVWSWILFKKLMKLLGLKSDSSAAKDLQELKKLTLAHLESVKDKSELMIRHDAEAFHSLIVGRF